MKIKIDKELKDNTYFVSLSILEPEIGNYLDGVHDYGEDAINFGGKIMDEDGTTVLASLADRNVKITDMIEKPFRQSFQISQYGENSLKIVEQWISNVKKKIDGYVKAVAAKTDDFTGTETIDI